MLVDKLVRRSYFCMISSSPNIAQSASMLSRGTSQNGHIPKKPQPERPHWVGSLPERPHYFGQNGHTALDKMAT